jgi:transcriptional regulator with XRE-family HTH domain
MAKPPVDEVRQRVRQGIGERLRYAREALGQTQRQVAEGLGLTSLSVINYEAGRTPFPTDLLPALDALGIDSSWVVSGIPCMENRATREQFVAISTWVKRELAIHELSITPTQEFELAWHVLCRLGTPSMRNVVEREQEIITTVRELLTTVAESLP